MIDVVNDVGLIVSAVLSFEIKSAAPDVSRAMLLSKLASLDKPMLHMVQKVLNFEEFGQPGIVPYGAV